MWYQGDNKVLDEPKIYLDGSYKDFGYGSIVRILKNKLKDGR